MIVSHKYKFIFIKTTKTAGTSIEVYLSRFCGEEDIVTSIFPPVVGHEPRNYRGILNPMADARDGGTKHFASVAKDFLVRPKFYNHLPAYRVRNRVSPNVWRNYFKFCVERNPWERVFSHYNMIRERGAKDLTLRDYFNKNYFFSNFPIYGSQSTGLPIVDKVCDFGSLNSDLEDVFSKIGIPFDGSLGLTAKPGSYDKESGKKIVLSLEQDLAIRECCTKEIGLFSYQRPNRFLVEK